MIAAAALRAAAPMPRTGPAAAIVYPDGACSRCAHSRASHDSGAGCVHPQVAGRGGPVPVTVARHQRGGACGIEAWHHDYRRATW